MAAEETGNAPASAEASGGGMVRSGLPLAYIANEQRVPDDFHLASARQTWLIKAAVEMMRRQDVPITDDFMAQSFAEAGLNEYS
jgi:hypothetical protein